MHATTKTVRNESSAAVTLAVDLANDVFELAFADVTGRIVARKRLKRGAVAECQEKRAPLRIVMEACGSAHAWPRLAGEQGFRAAWRLPANASPQASGLAGMMAREPADRALAALAFLTIAV